MTDQQPTRFCCHGHWPQDCPLCLHLPVIHSALERIATALEGINTACGDEHTLGRIKDALAWSAGKASELASNTASLAGALATVAQAYKGRTCPPAAIPRQTRSNTHGGELCIISSHRTCEEPTGTAPVGASSTEMMQDFPLHV